MASEYLIRGVSPTKDDVHAATEHVWKGLYPGAFCKLIPDLACSDFAAVLHADGAGTKAIVAYLIYKEGGGPEVFRGIAQDSMVMNLDDMLCVGARGEFVVSNTIGRNAHRCGAEVVAAVIQGYSDFSEKMNTLGLRLTLAGGETADVGDLVQTLIVDSTFYTRLRKTDVVDCSNIRPGNVIVGLESSGQATYEDRPNSGIGSNGLTLARHVLLHEDYSVKYPETYSPTIAPENVFCGPYHLDSALPGGADSVGEALLSPTRTYAPIIRDLLDEAGQRVCGIIHCTGGGQVKCRGFGRDLHFVKHSLFEVPPIFQAVQEAGRIEAREMFQTFNMGHRMEVYCDPDTASTVISKASKHRVAAKVVGEVRPASKSQLGNRVTLRSGGRDYEYP